MNVRIFLISLFGLMGWLCSGFALGNPCADNILVEDIDLVEDVDRITPGQNEILLPDVSAVKGQALTDSLMSSIASELLTALQEQGYWNGEVSVESIELKTETCGVAIVLRIDPGPETRFQGYRWSGLNTYEPTFFEQILPWKAGDPVSSKSRRQARQTLLSTGLFRDVDEGVWELGDQGLILHFRVQELRQNALDGMIGYAPGPDGNGLLAGYGDLRLRNLVLPGNDLNLRYEQLTRSVSRLDATVRQIYPAGLPVSIGAGMHFLQQDTLYLQQELRAEGEYFLRSGFSVIGSGEIRRVRASESLQPDTRSVLWGVGFRWFSLDHAVVPRRGYEILLRGDIELRSRLETSSDVTAEIPARQRIQRFRVSGQAFLSPARRWVLAIRGEARHLAQASDSYLITDLYRFGGTQTVRGYAEDQFRASTLAWADLEPRLLLDRQTYLFAFGTVGRYTRPRTGAARRTAWIGSFGAGIAYQTPLGMMRVSYALSPDDSFSSSKIHVALGLQ